jgi:exonuclease SbcD
MGHDPMYDLSTFDLPNVGFVALGHIHKHQALHYASPQVVYAGSIDRVDFGEQDEPKGWVYVELPLEKGASAEWEFRPVAARPFLTIDARVESENATEDVVRAIARTADRLAGAVVRVRIEVPPERVHELRDDEIREQLRAAYYVAPFERTSQQRTRSRWGAAGAAIQQAAPLEALALYLEHQKVEASRRDTLLRYARALMADEAESTEGPSQVWSTISAALTHDTLTRKEADRYPPESETIVNADVKPSDSGADAGRADDHEVAAGG